MQSGRVRSLDGVRALAILAVFLSHSSLPFTDGGWIGVDVFFVLSGFLITQILASEWEMHRRVSFRNFYVRRILRLYPGLLCLMVFAFLIRNRLHAPAAAAELPGDAWRSGLYLTDLFHGFGGPSGGLLSVTWSLGVEEQFYLLWPVVLIAVLSRGWNIQRALVAACLASLALNFLLISRNGDGGNLPDAYFLPWTHLPLLLAGCALALDGPPRSSATRRVVGSACGVLLVVAIPVISQFPRQNWLAADLTVICALAAGLVYGLRSSSDSAASRLLSLPPVAYLGSISYGFYLYHALVIDWLQSNLLRSRFLDTALALFVTIVMAVASFRYIETPFLKLKRRFDSGGYVERPAEATAS